MEDEEPDDAGDRGCDAVGPEEQRTVDRQAADLRVGERGPEEEGERDRDLRCHESVWQPPVPEDEALHRGWPSRPSLVERGELLKDLARLRDRVVQPLLRRLLAAEDVLHLLLDGVADGGEVAKANALTVRRGLAAEHL